jgi:hypothetical protein
LTKLVVYEKNFTRLFFVGPDGDQRGPVEGPAVIYHPLEFSYSR